MTELTEVWNQQILLFQFELMNAFRSLNEIEQNRFELGKYSFSFVIAR